MTKMTNLEAIAVLDSMKVKIDIPNAAVTQRKRNEAIEMAIEALEVEPCEDAISREAVWTKITNGALPLESPEQFIDRISKEVEAMPSVTPKRKTGKILTDYAIGIDKKGFERKFVNTRYCSLCKCDLGYNADILTHYCPNCGAKMENEE